MLGGQGRFATINTSAALGLGHAPLASPSVGGVRRSDRVSASRHHYGHRSFDQAGNRVSPTGSGVKSARVSCSVPVAGVGATADATFTSVDDRIPASPESAACRPCCSSTAQTLTE
jgi:hypothetical protein